MVACVETPSDQSYEAAVRRLKAGEIVAFPTETVYGLGGNARDESAVQKIFRLKGRPATDPLIVHVLNTEDAALFCEWPSKNAENLFLALADSFWPGPLTMVCPKAPSVLSSVTAGTGFVGLRSPVHEVARTLLKLAGMPLAAPSANLFGHVSPSTAQHVFDDFSESNLLILDGGATDVGIESTVVKIVSETQIVILRRGAVSKSELTKVLREKGLNVAIEEVTKHAKSETIAHEAPGQLLKHYSPYLPCYLVDNESGSLTGEQVSVKDCVLIDFNSTYRAEKNKFFKFFELKSAGNADEAAHQLFNFLREAEKLQAKKILISLPNVQESSELFLAVFDRAFRAAEGKKAFISLGSDLVFCEFHSQ